MPEAQFLFTWDGKIVADVHMEQPTKDRLLGMAGLALGLLGWAGPSLMPKMPTYLSYPMVLVGLLLILYTALQAVGHARAERTKAKVKAMPIARAPDSEEFLPLDEAARRLYEEARRCNSMWALAAERLGGKTLRGGSTPDEVLDYMATFIGGRTEIYGVRPPSRITEMIAPSEVKASGFAGGAKRIERVAGGGAEFTELKIRRGELDGLIAHVCADSKEGSA